MKKYIVSLLFLSSLQYAMSQEAVFDSHVHLWNGDQSLQEYLAQLDSTNQTVTKFGGILIAKQGEPATTKAKNNELIALSKKNPKLIPVCSVHPLDGDTAIQELKRLSTLGVKIVKLHPHTQNFDVTDDRVLKLCSLAGKQGITILMDNSNIKPGDSENLFNLAIKCSETKYFRSYGRFQFSFLEHTQTGPDSENFL